MLEIPLAANWIWKLSNKLGKLRVKRKGKEAAAAEAREDKIQAIADVLGSDPEELAELYIEPRTQFFNPADHNEDEAESMVVLRGVLRETLNGFFTKPIRFPTGQQFLFILADAGMGKSSLLAMLKLTHLTGDFWQDDVHFELLKLGPSTLDDVQKIRSARKTVLLLDSLDEDPEAFDDVETRLQKLMAITKGFRRVIITCRTQFFPEDSDIEKPGRISVGDYEKCSLLYLSPFDDEQVAEYLKKRFSDEEMRKRASKAVEKMHSLRMRPMLLAYIEDLIDEEKDDWNEFAVYETLLEKWLIREAQKGVGVDRGKLKDACLLLARRLQIDEKRHLSRDEFDHLSLKHPELEEVPKLALEGRALLNRTGEGEFRFAHFSIQEFLAVAGLAWGRFDYMEEVFGRTEMTYTFARGSRWTSISAKRPQEDLNKLIRIALFLVAADFRNVDFCNSLLLVKANLTFANLSGANLTNAYLARVNLTDANLSGTILTHANLTNAYLTGANFTCANLRGADLRHANLFRSDLTDTDLTDADFTDADFADANLTRADLTRANLTNANLTNANLTGAHLTDAHLSAANLRGAALRGADLRDADLTRADLRDADLTHANLAAADLRNAKVTYANFRGAQVTDEQLAQTFGKPTDR